jgi:hypothetical protein
VAEPNKAHFAPTESMPITGADTPRPKMRRGRFDSREKEKQIFAGATLEPAGKEQEASGT